jgi:hypothetical protein
MSPVNMPGALVYHHNRLPFCPPGFEWLFQHHSKPGFVIARMRFKKTRLILTSAGALWLLMIGAGIGTLWNYESTPGVADVRS